MKSMLAFLIVLFVSTVTNGYPSRGKKIACFYDHKAVDRVEIAKVGPAELKPALSMCNYLIYGYIGFDKEKYEVHSLDESIDLVKGKNNFKKVTELKKQFPSVKFLVSLGGFRDLKNEEKYLEVLEKEKRRASLINSLVKLVKDYDFDGIDLAWQFPVVKEKKERSTLGSIWHSIKETVSSNADSKEAEHKEEFSTFVKEVSAAMRGEKRGVTLTILPHVNSAAYIDVSALKDWVEQVHLMTLDYRTPERTKSEADYSAPLQWVPNRVTEQNVEATVNWWLNQRMPGDKLLIAVPTYGRTWKITKDSGKTGTPPVKHADGPGEKGPYLKTEGILSYFEICPHLASQTSAADSKTLLVRVPDPEHKRGSYAFRAANDKSGIWVSYEEPEVALKKAQFVRNKGLGGVAVVDITLDDFKGGCDKAQINYPILKAVEVNLG